MIPADISPLARAVALDRQIADLELEISSLKQQREAFVRVAIEDGIRSDGVYELKTKTRRSIDAKRFRALYPTVYDDIAVISATAAEKILGKELLRHAVMTRYPDQFAEFATVNVGDAEKRLGKTGLPPEVVVVNTIPGSIKIVRIGEIDE
jgi:hypothetical protein